MGCALPLLLLAAGCAAQPALYTRAVLVKEDSELTPSKRVETLEEAPERPYETIALLETSMAPGATLPELLESMREKAKELGADAITDIQSEERTTPRQFTTEPWFGGFYTYGGERTLVTRARAIRFTP